MKLPMVVLRKKYCCCVPLSIWSSTFESAIKPPLDQSPLSERTMAPLRWTLRSQVACEVAQTRTLLSS